MKKVKDLHFWIDRYREVEKSVEELALAYDFVKEEVITESELDEIYQRTITLIEDLELRNMLRREEDKLGAVLKINSGAGGTESQDWADMLMRLYLRWCEAHGYTRPGSSRLPYRSRAIMPMAISKAKTEYTVWYVSLPIMHRVNV